MPVKLEWAIERMERYAPTDTALEWDNVGLLIGDRSQTISRIMTALDFTNEVAAEAIRQKVDLVITHHPMIFKPINRVTADTALGYRIITAIRHDIAVYAAHTNLDRAEGGTNDALFALLPLADKESLQIPSRDKGTYALGRAGRLTKEMTLRELASKIKAILGLPHCQYVGDGGKLMRRVAICTGSSAESRFYKAALALHCDAYITGDIGFHDAQAALEIGLSLIDATHYGSERLIVDTLVSYLRQAASDDSVQVDIVPSQTNGQMFQLE